MLYNYCKRALVLRSHHLCVWLDIAYSTSVMSWYYPDAVYLHRWWALQVGWCLDSLCGGSITGSLVCHLPLCFQSQYQWGDYPPGWCVCGRGGLIVSAGKKQECVPACCVVLRYKIHEFAEPFYYQLMHIMSKNTELLKHSKITLQHVSVYIETIFRELKSVLG